MAIEIKELLVKFSVEGSSTERKTANTEFSLNNSEIKEIINSCTEEVLRKINRIGER